jgi:hypothetical protein
MTDVNLQLLTQMSLPHSKSHETLSTSTFSVLEMLLLPIYTRRWHYRIRNSNNKINGTLFNYGIQEVTIPGLLISYYNSEKKLIYVDHFLFMKVLGSSANSTLNIIY